MKSNFIILIALTLPFSTYSQDSKLINFLLFGKEKAEIALSRYMEPVDQSLMYALTGGWTNTAETLAPWKFKVGLITNGTFIPSEKQSFELNIYEFHNLEIEGGASFIKLPTILGGDQTSVKMTVAIDDEHVEFDSPSGMGLVSINLMPSAFLQGSVGLPIKNTELVFRYFPKLKIDESKIGILGVALQHEFFRLFDSKVAIAGFAGFANLSANYAFKSEGKIVLGENENVDLNLNTWTFKAIASTQFPTFNAFIGAGYVSGNAETRLLGDYTIPLPNRTIEFQDPLTISNKVSGAIVNIGGKVSFGKVFSTVLEYTIQGYNNFSLGFEFKI